MNRWFKRTVCLAAMVAATVPALAFAEDSPPYATFPIKIESNPVASDLSPIVAAPITKDTVAFHIMNNTGKQLFFNNGKDSEYVPLVSNATVEAPYAPGMVYKVADAEGNLIASWHIDDAKIQKANVSSASASDFASWGNTLQQVIENQKVTYQEPPAKPEPRYYTSSGGANSRAESRRTVVRGFW